MTANTVMDTRDAVPGTISVRGQRQWIIVLGAVEAGLLSAALLDVVHRRQPLTAPSPSRWVRAS